MKPRDPQHDRRQRRLLVGIALLFFMPLAASFYLYYGQAAWRPGKHVNRGELITPARPLPSLALPLLLPSSAPGAGTRATATAPDFLEKKWTLMYLGAGTCTGACRTHLYQTRQVRLSLNRDMDRVQRVFLARGACCDWEFLQREHPDLTLIRADDSAQALIELLPRYGGVEPFDADRVYLVDPLGNLMMSYAPDSKPKGMLEDLKRLLGLSSVG